LTGTIIGVLLVGHGLVHACYLAPAPATTGGPRWPFAMDDSWLIRRVGADGQAVRLAGRVLICLTVVGFTLAGLAAVGVLPASVFAPLAFAAAAASIALLVLFLHPWILLGFVIDGVVLWAVLMEHWTPTGL
jgi:hypothetical protein